MIGVLNANLTRVQRHRSEAPTSARHELKTDVVELLLGVPQPEDEADGNAGVGCSWILQRVNMAKS